MMFGLTIDLISFGPKVIFKYQPINLLHKTDTLEILAVIFVLFLRKYLKFESKDIPTIQTLPYYLSEILSGINDPKYKAIFQVFFYHLYTREFSNHQFFYTQLIKLNGRFLITPLFQQDFTYSPDTFTLITQKDSFFLFETLTKEAHQPFTWKLENGWLYALKQHYVVKENLESGFWLVEIPSDIVYQLYKYYSFLLEIFKTFPFTSDEEDNKMEIYHYITIMMDFLKDKNKSE